MVAVTMPAAATTSVLAMPTRSARPKDESDVYSISLSEMSKPARPRRKAKPVEMFDRRRFSTVLSTIHHTPSASSATSRTWKTMPRTRGL